MSLGTLQSNQLSLLKVQQQIATGQRLSLPSDDPAATVGIMGLNQQIAANTQYNNNLTFASGFLGMADSTLSNISTLVTQAQSIANSMVGSTATADQRAAQGQIVNSLLQQLQDLANTQYRGQAVFGGQSGSQNPFIAADGGYKYVGTQQGQGILTASGAVIPYTVNGSQVFGGQSAEVAGSQNLTPSLTATTRLVDLTGASLKGISSGSIGITIGSPPTSTLNVDLSRAANVGDVVNMVNAALAAAGSDATLSTNGGSFVLQGDSTQAITIGDVGGGGSMASDLGLTGTTAAGAVTTGTPLQPKITATTTIASLRNGAGIDPTGFIITNGSQNATITLDGVTTVGDLLNKINGSGTNVTAEINAAGNGINLFNPVSGCSMTIGENGGSTADDLGIRSFTTSVRLSDLNLGVGVSTSSLPGLSGSIVVTRTDGSQFSVKTDGITTPDQLIAAINNAGGGTVTAALNSTGNGITLSDTSGGTGNLTVTAGSDFISNGSDLGIFQVGTDGTLTGGDITFSTDDFRITRRDGTSFTVNLAGASTIQDVLDRINNADGNNGANAVTASLNPTGNGIELSDASTGSGSLSVTSLNASQAAEQLGILKSSTTGVIAGDDVNPVQPQGLFSTLSQLRDALLSNDTAGIQRAAALLETDGQRVITANGVIGAREQDLQSRQNNLTSEQTQLQSLLSLLQDTDMTSAITQYQLLTGVYQAALQVTANNQSLSLLDFLQ